jgi:uncharacterized integral membrane protein
MGGPHQARWIGGKEQAQQAVTFTFLYRLLFRVPIAGLVCLLIAVISIVNVTSTSHQLVGLQVEWGLWVVAIASAVLCATASVAAAQVGTVDRGFTGMDAHGDRHLGTYIARRCPVFLDPVDRDQHPAASDGHPDGTASFDCLAARAEHLPADSPVGASAIGPGPRHEWRKL